MTTNTATVEVPATSANLGPGFDSLGVALDWTLRISFEAKDEPVEAPTNPIAQMAAQAALALYSRAAAPTPAGLDVSVETNGLPVGRGLGISAAARVAGLVAANALTEGGHDLETLLPLAVQLERHGDNAAPAMFGGLQIVIERDEGGDVMHFGLTPPEELRLVLLVPGFSMPTEETRRKLPDRVTRNQAVHNIGRAALLIAALEQRRYDLLQTATEDVLHQPARATVFEPMYPIFQAARDAGAHGVFLSGGGPTIAAFATERFEDIEGAMREAAAVRGVEAKAVTVGLRTDRRGAAPGRRVAGPDLGEREDQDRETYGPRRSEVRRQLGRGRREDPARRAPDREPRRGRRQRGRCRLGDGQDHRPADPPRAADHLGAAGARDGRAAVHGRDGLLDAALDGAARAGAGRDQPQRRAGRDPHRRRLRARADLGHRHGAAGARARRRVAW